MKPTPFFIEYLITNIEKTGRGKKQIIAMLVDLLCVVGSLWLAMSLRYGEVYTSFNDSWLLFSIIPVLTVAIFAGLGIYQTIVKYSGARVYEQLIKGVLVSAIAVVVVGYLAGVEGLPRSVFIIYGFILISMESVIRGVWQKIHYKEQHSQGEPIAIYGAGAAGRQLQSMLETSPEYRPVIFLDDERALNGREVNGLPVYGSNAKQIQAVINKNSIHQILLAIPSASRIQLKEIIEKISKLDVTVKTIPSVQEICSGLPINALRDISVDEILGREPVKPNSRLMSKKITGKTVLVTGGGGSIGSELCRQIINLSPKQLIIYDSCEKNLYDIDQELSGANVNIKSILGSVLDENRLDGVFKNHCVSTIYHAAAYKHVPIVENNPVEGLKTNVMGTKNVIDAAHKYKVDSFVLISTDKAVRPTNVMGASKRIAEMLVQNIAIKNTETVFSMVRFGNVLGSSGSVVPKFIKQIQQGGPVTITHPEITRYFMTIPEAAQLVIQAGAMAEGGEVFVLDMGESVKIVDLAKSMIKLKGHEVLDENNVHGDIEIVFTGLRPGEKLYEELLIDFDNNEATNNPKIMKAREKCLDSENINNLLNGLDDVVSSGVREDIKNLLCKYLDDYKPFEVKSITSRDNKENNQVSNMPERAQIA